MDRKSVGYLACLLAFLISSSTAKSLWGDPESRYDEMQVDPYGYADNGLNEMMKPPKGCWGKPADIYFLLDASESVGPADFKRAKQYASDLVPTFDTKQTRIGVITFSDRVYSAIPLGKYRDNTKLQAAIQRIPFIGGNPNIPGALRYLWSKAFSRKVARPSVGHIAITITNGNSGNTGELIAEARRADKTGIYMYAVYTREDADARELSEIASKPMDDFLFSMDSYNIVAFTEDILGSKPCNDVQVHPPQEKQVCETKRPADIVFAVDYATIGVVKARKVIQFVSDSLQEFDIGSDRIHIGVVSNQCPSKLDVDLTSYTKDGVMEKVNDIFIPGQAELLKKARRQSFSRFYGSRPDVQRTLVMFVDDDLDQPERVRREAKRTKDRKVQIIVVAIGPKVNIKDLSRVATGADSVVQLSSYDELLEAKDKILRFICRGL